MNIDTFIPKFHTREENERIFYEYNMKLLDLDFTEMAVNEMFEDKKISKNDYSVWKNKIAKRRAEL